MSNTSDNIRDRGLAWSGLIADIYLNLSKEAIVEWLAYLFETKLRQWESMELCFQVRTSIGQTIEEQL